MTHRSLAVLIVLNAALLLALAGVVLSPRPAHAQFGSSVAKYTMIAGGVTGRSGQDAVYIVDTTSSKVAPVFYNASSKKIEYFNGRVILDDIKRLSEGR